MSNALRALLNTAFDEKQLRAHDFFTEALSKRQRKVAFWSIETPIGAYGMADALSLPDDSVRRAANMRTRLNRFTTEEIELLLKAGYAGADASLRARGLATEAPAADFRGLITSVEREPRNYPMSPFGT